MIKCAICSTNIPKPGVICEECYVDKLQADKQILVEVLKEIIEDDSTWAYIQNICYSALRKVGVED